MSFERLANLFFLNRKVSASLLIGISLVALYGLSQLKFDDDLDSIFRGNSNEQALLDELSEQIQFEQTGFLVLFEAEDLFSNEVIATLRELHFDLQDIDGVAKVQSILQARDGNLSPIIPGPGADGDQLKKARNLLRDVPGFGSNEGKNATLLIVDPVNPGAQIEELDQIYEELKAAAQNASNAGLVSTGVSGLPALRCELVDIEKRELPLLILVGALLGTAAALSLFRSWFAWIATFPVPLIAAFWSLGLMGITGRTFDLISIVIPPLAMAIAITDAVHLLCGIREKIEEGHSPKEATRLGIRLVGPACFLSSLTTMFAFLSLTLSSSPMLSRFGVTCAGVTLAVFTSTLLWVPFITTTRSGKSIGRKKPPPGPSGHSPATKHPALFVRASVALLAICLLFVSQFRPDYKFSENLSATNPAMETLASIDGWFGYSGHLNVMIEWPHDETFDSIAVRQLITNVEATLKKSHPESAPISLHSLMRQILASADAGSPIPGWLDLPRTVTERFLNPEARRTVITFPVGDRGSRELVPLFSRINEGLDELRRSHPGYRIELTGPTFVHAVMSERMIRNLGQGLAFAALGIFLIVGLVFKSFDFAFKSILPNLLPLAGTAAILVIAGQSMHYNTVLALTIGLGIAIDDSIQFLFRFRHELKVSGGDAVEAANKTLNSVGSALTTTSIVLITGLGALLFCSLPMARVFAIIIIMVIVFALIADLYILPALMCLKQKPKLKQQ